MWRIRWSDRIILWRYISNVITGWSCSVSVFFTSVLLMMSLKLTLRGMSGYYTHNSVLNVMWVVSGVDLCYLACIYSCGLFCLGLYALSNIFWLFSGRDGIWCLFSVNQCYVRLFSVSRGGSDISVRTHSAYIPMWCSRTACPTVCTYDCCYNPHRLDIQCESVRWDPSGNWMTRC